jgi:hypothetical protein
MFNEAGGILDEPSIAAIEGVRQIAYTFKKLEVPCAPNRVRRALSTFTSSEHVFREVTIDPGDASYFASVSRGLWGYVFGTGEFVPVLGTVPKHGPGATAEEVSGNAKYLVGRWHDRLEPYFPLLSTAFSSESAYGSKEFEKVSIIEEADEQPVRVIPVPKTLKAPRIIAIEPVCMQYSQQALSRAITTALESHWLTRGHINFSDQSVNRALALSSSRDGRFATIDLSSASDRVPYAEAIRMFDSNPDLRDAISACRSTRAQMPDGSIVELSKFASMGSALCFPVEAMYFYTICVAALLRERNLSVTTPNIAHVGRDVYVYGDDILVPTHESDAVIRTLHKYYCKVNVHKSFTSGNFRESCGMDAFYGEEVTPTYVRQVRPETRQNANALISWVASGNLFYKRGYWKTASHMFNVCESILGTLPIVGERCAGLGKLSYQPCVSAGRYSRKYQVEEVNTWVASPVYREDKLDGYAALTKCLLSLEAKSSSLLDIAPSDEKHLERTARHGAVVLKRRWVRPY